MKPWEQPLIHLLFLTVGIILGFALGKQNVEFNTYRQQVQMQDSIQQLHIHIHHMHQSLHSLKEDYHENLHHYDTLHLDSAVHYILSFPY
jgi:hypothetical protein